ncbi:MAG: hypothetical protein P4L41_12670 [Flavipsychrobacter sp.]|nr:hypothetical protein [Flavipsychrobacter sp.]
MTLKPLTIQGNLVKLEWSKLDNSSLVSYAIVRILDTVNLGNYGSVKYINIDKTVTSYTDTLVLNPYVQYYVIAYVTSTNYQSANVQSNKETYMRTDIDFAAMAATDALYDRNNKQLYVYSSAGMISVYDLASAKFVRTLNSNATIGACDLAMYNGKLELYVPRNDGWVFIYDAATLTQINQVNVGTAAYYVANNNGKLFVTSTASYSYTYNVTVYDRATLTPVTQASYYYNSPRMALVPGTNTELYAVHESGYLMHLRYDAQGKFISGYRNISTASSGVSTPLAVYADASHVLLGNGQIIDSTMTTVVSLPRGTLNYFGFAIDDAGGIIYAATTAPSIQAYNMSNYQAGKKYATVGNPVKVFYDNGKLITVSVNGDAGSQVNYPTGNFTFVEQL